MVIDSRIKGKDLFLPSGKLFTMEDYDSMFYIQEGKCWICKTPQENLRCKLAIDHSHKTGLVRGLLCSHCNLGIGNFYDDPIRLKNAITYLKRRLGNK